MPDHDIDGRLKQSPSLPVKKASLLGLDLSLRGRFTIHLEAMKLFSGNIGWGVLFFYFFYSFGLASAHGTFTRKEVTHSSRVPVSVNVTKGYIQITWFGVQQGL